MTASSLKILVVRVGRVGDMVMITPALNALITAFPDAEIHLLTSPEGRRVLHGYHTRLTRFLIYGSGVLGRFLDRPGLLRTIRQNRYGAAYVFESDARFHRLFMGSEGSAYLLQGGPPEQHYCERCLSLVEQSLAEPILRTFVTLPVTEDAKKRAAQYFQGEGIEENCRVIGFHATFSSASALWIRKRKARLHRTWPARSFVRLSQLLDGYANQKGIPIQIVMDVLPEERKLVEPIVRESRGLIHLLSAPPDFERYKGTLARMNLFVTPDTGPMHIAGAVGTPVVALFSHKSPADCGPFVPEIRKAVLRAEDTPHPERGLAAISPESVLSACLPFLP